MAVLEQLAEYARQQGGETKEKKGVLTLSFVVAEKKGLLSKKKVKYEVRVGADADAGTVKIFESISESGSGAGGGMDDFSMTRGFEKEVEKLRKKYDFSVDPADIRARIAEIAKSSGATVESVKSPRKLK